MGAWEGIGDRVDGMRSKMDNSLGGSHLSGLFNRYLLTECGQKGIRLKKSSRRGIQVRLNFLGVGGNYQLS